MHIVSSFAGMLLILAIAVALSHNRRAIRLRVVGPAFALQVGLAALVLRFAAGQRSHSKARRMAWKACSAMPVPG